MGMYCCLKERDHVVGIYYQKKKQINIDYAKVDTAEWLKRQTWNLLGFARADSKPCYQRCIRLTFFL